MTKLTPRLLVVDDDPGVIAAYKLVLKTMRDLETTNHLFGLSALEEELFGYQEPEAPEQAWRVEYVYQGADAVREVQWSLHDNDPFAAIFLDVRMPPGIDGRETAMLIRKIDPNVHIVIVTAFSDYTYEELLEVAGPADRMTHMPKPVWPEELRKVARVLSSRRSTLNPLGLLDSVE